MTPPSRPGNSAVPGGADEPLLRTFSICAYDPEAKQWGVGVASKIVAVGAYVPWAEAKSGALATQAGANLDHGPSGLRMLADGKAAHYTTMLRPCDQVVSALAVRTCDE